MESARPAVATDLERVASLWSQAEVELGKQRGGALLFRSVSLAPPVAEGLSEALGQSDRVLAVGLIDAVIVGFGYGRVAEMQEHRRALTASARLGSNHLGVIEVLYVEPPGRGIGVGEAIVEVMVEHFGRQGCLGYDAFALPGDRTSKAFFETQGFVTRLLVMHRATAGHDSTPGA